MAKSLCKLRKNLMTTHFDQYVDLISAPQYVCKKCGRAANSGRNLCKPKAIAKHGSLPASAPILIDDVIIRRKATA